VSYHCSDTSGIDRKNFMPLLLGASKKVSWFRATTGFEPLILTTVAECNTAMLTPLALTEKELCCTKNNSFHQNKFEKNCNFTAVSLYSLGPRLNFRKLQFHQFLF
jgi:hypothetical protein